MGNNITRTCGKSKYLTQNPLPVALLSEKIVKKTFRDLQKRNPGANYLSDVPAAALLARAVLYGLRREKEMTGGAVGVGQKPELNGKFMRCDRKIGWFVPLLAAFLLVTAFAGCSGNRVPASKMLDQAVDAARQGEWQKVFQLARSVLKHETANPDALVLHAIAAEKLGRIDLALNSARKAAELYPGHFAAQYTLGRLLCARPDSAAAALPPLERALKARPGDPNTLLLLGRAASRINADDSINYYQMLPAAVQARPEVQTQMAIYYLARRAADPANLVRAKEALHNAFKVSNKNPQTVLNLALFLDYYTPDRSRAYRFYRSYLDSIRNDPELNPERAQVRARMRELER